MNTRERIQKTVKKAVTTVVVKTHLFTTGLGMLTLARPREWFERRKDGKEQGK